MEGGLDVRARHVLDDGLHCMTEDAAVHLRRGRYSFFAGITIVGQRQACDCYPGQNECTPWRRLVTSIMIAIERRW